MSTFGEIPPNQAIYISNLNEKLKRTELKRNLYLLFARFGNIIEINCEKTEKLRGQAWVIYEDLSGATRAVKDMQKFDFFGKPIKVSYAKNKSDVVAKIDGTYVSKEQAAKKAEKDKKKKEQFAKRAEAAAKKAAAEQTRLEQEAAKHALEMTKKKMEVEEEEDQAEPNKLLFLENLPVQCNKMMLEMLFQQYTGYKEARMVNGKPGIAFVEFENETQSTAAKGSLQGFKITPQNLLKITFARQ